MTRQLIKEDKMQHLKNEMHIKMQALIAERLHKQDKFNEKFLLRYDEIYWRGMEWLDSL